MPANSGLKDWWGYRSYNLSGDAAHNLSVNTGNGNLVVSVIDYVFPARIPSVVMRTYNHSDAATVRMLGKGWRFSFEEEVETLGGGDVKYTDTTGAEFTWVKSGPNYNRPTGVFTDLTLDSGAGEYTLTMPNGFLRVFDSTTGLLKRYEDTNGNIQRFLRDVNDRITDIEINTPSGYVALLDTFTYDPGSGNLTGFGLSSVSGLDWVLAYSSGDPDLLESITDPEGNIWSYTYNGNDFLDSIMDPRGNVAGTPYSTGIAYDGSDRVQTITDALSETIGFAYAGLVTTVTDRRGNDTIMTHATTTLALLSIELPLAPPDNTTSFVWTNLTLTMVTDALGRETEFLYDSDGNLEKITDAMNEETIMSYDGDNNLRTITTPLGLVTEFDYDANRNLERIDRELGPDTVFEYDTNGDMLQVTDPSGQRRRFTYDETYGVTLTVSDLYLLGGSEIPLTTTYEYAAAALWVEKVTNPSFRVINYAHDALGRTTDVSVVLTNVTNLVTSYFYDECGNVIKTTPPKGQGGSDFDTDFAYNKLNLLETVTLPETASGVSSEYGYDEEENLVSLKRYLLTPSSVTLETVYTYDTVNRLEKIRLPLIGGGSPPADSEFNFTYDPVGNLKSKSDPEGNTVTYDYTVLNQVQFEYGPVTDLEYEYQYDVDGRLTHLIGQPNGPLPDYSPRTYEYAYDNNNRLVTVIDPLGGETKYTYYGNDQLHTITLPRQAASPNGGPASRTYLYDSVGRLQRVSDAIGAAINYTYRNDGLLAFKIDAESRWTIYDYDGAGRTTRIDYSRELGSFSAFQYDENSNLIELTGGDSFKTTYDYDDRDRMILMARHETTGMSPLQYDTTYEYDELGRMLSSIDPRNKKTTHVYDNQSRLIQTNVDVNHGAISDGFDYEFKYDYDLAGRLKVKTHPDLGTIQYDYDELNRITSYTDEAGGVITSSYDLWGTMVERVFQDNTKETYHYDELGRVDSQKNHYEEEYTYGYDQNGNNTSLDTPYALATVFGYNDRDELIFVGSTSADGSIRLVENFSYTNNGRLDSYTGPNQESWTFHYDGLGRWDVAESNLGTKATRSYNPSNTLKTSTDTKGLAFSMTYNGMRLRTATTAESDSPPSTTEYDWDYIDLEEVREANGRVSNFLRDRLGRITSMTLTEGMSTYTTGYQYNWRNQVTQRTLPNSLCVEDYSYDERGLLSQVDFTNPSGYAAMLYDARGRQTSIKFSSGAAREYVYNRVGRMIGDSVVDSDGNIFTTTYAYDQAGNRVINALDRKYPDTSILPAYLIQDEFGNPIVQTGNATPTTPITNYNRFTYTGYSAAHSSVTIEHRVKTGGAGPDEVLMAYETGNPSNPYGFSVDASDLFGDTHITLNDPNGPFTYSITGSRTLAPSALGGNPRLKDNKVQLDPAGNVKVEQNQVGAAASPTTDDYDWGGQCCGSNSAESGGNTQGANKAGRSSVVKETQYAKSLLSAGNGSFNQLTEPWTTLVDPSGPSVGSITIAYLEPDYKSQLENLLSGEVVQYGYDVRTGKPYLVQADPAGSPTDLAEYSYDSYGRLISATDHTGGSPSTINFHNDWLTGNTTIADSGSDPTSYTHAPGFSRTGHEDSPSNWSESFLVRGPHGQVKLNLDNDGKATDWYGYSSFGNRTDINTFIGAGILPIYLDSDLAPIAGMDQSKSGGGTTQDMTPFAGARDRMQESGAGGLGASANPDTAQGGNATFMQSSDRWNFHGTILPEHLPPSDFQLPGMGSDMAPTFAPPTAQDMATMADQRLAGAWGSQDYFGPKPGKQSGSRFCDDIRNPRMPLPMIPPVGGAQTGPPGYETPGILPAYLADDLTVWPKRSYGPRPQLENPFNFGGFPPFFPPPGGEAEGNPEEKEEEKDPDRPVREINSREKTPDVPEEESTSLEDAMNDQDEFANWPGWVKNKAIDHDEPDSAAGTYLDGPLGGVGLGEHAAKALDSITGGGFSTAVENAMRTNPDLMAGLSTASAVATAGALMAVEGLVAAKIAAVAGKTALAKATSAVVGTLRKGLNWTADAAAVADDIIKNGMSDASWHHIYTRHTPRGRTGGRRRGTFNTSNRPDIDNIIREALKRADGDVPNTEQRPGWIVTHTFGSPIGLTDKGRVTNRIKIVLEKGIGVVSAYPVR